jgi:hypothetical protein
MSAALAEPGVRCESIVGGKFGLFDNQPRFTILKPS